MKYLTKKFLWIVSLYKKSSSNCLNYFNWEKSFSFDQYIWNMETLNSKKIENVEIQDLTYSYRPGHSIWIKLQLASCSFIEVSSIFKVWLWMISMFLSYWYLCRKHTPLLLGQYRKLGLHFLSELLITFCNILLYNLIPKIAQKKQW